MRFFLAFFPYSGHIEDTKSVEFVSVAISSTFFHKMTVLIAQILSCCSRLNEAIAFLFRKMSDLFNIYENIHFEIKARLHFE